MDLKVIINALLILVLLHLLLRNFNLNKIFYIFGGNRINGISENFINNINSDTNNNIDYNINNMNNSDKSLEFLLNYSGTENAEDKKEHFNNCYQELTDYVDKCSVSNVKPGNYYLEDENTANFRSNVLNINKFYKIDHGVPGSYDGLDSSNLSDLFNKQTTLNKIEEQKCFPDRRVRGNTETCKPDNWNYKNEFMMNGGNIFGNVVGFDSLNSGFAMYNDQNLMVTNDCLTKEDCARKPDDIRMGLGYPNEKQRELLA